MGVMAFPITNNSILQTKTKTSKLSIAELLSEELIILTKFPYQKATTEESVSMSLSHRR